MYADKLTDTSDGGRHLPWICRKIIAWINGYDHNKYWKRRAIVIDPSNHTNKLLKIFYLLWIKRVDSKHHCPFCTSYHSGSQFVTPTFTTWA